MKCWSSIRGHVLQQVEQDGLEMLYGRLPTTRSLATPRLARQRREVDLQHVGLDHV
jgi:hypothetical protein